MSNELAMLDAGLPSYLKEMELDDATKALMGGGSDSHRISIKGGVWRMMVNGKEIAKNEERAMNVVVVAAAPKVSRTFYMKSYTEGGEVSGPDCWSADGEVPDAKAAAPQSKRCVDCEQNVKGSGQGDSRACRYSQRLAVVLANDIGGDVFQLTLPGQSVFGEGAPGKWPLKTYAKMIGGKGIPITAVVTEMRFDTDSATPKLTFKPVRVLDGGEHTQVIEQGKSDSALKAITMTVAEADQVKKPVFQIEAKPEPKPEPKPKAEPKPEPVAEETPEPVKRTAKPVEEATADKKDLSKILDAWDDE